MPRRIAEYFIFVKTQWLVVLLIFSTHFALAYTSYPVDVHCPIDSTEFTIFETRSYYLRGYLKDFQMVGAVGGYYRNVVHSCPKCHYSGYRSDFDTTFSEHERLEILHILEHYKDYEMIIDWNGKRISAVLKRFKNEEYDMYDLEFFSGNIHQSYPMEKGQVTIDTIVYKISHFIYNNLEELPF